LARRVSPVAVGHDEPPRRVGGGRRPPLLARREARSSPPPELGRGDGRDRGRRAELGDRLAEAGERAGGGGGIQVRRIRGRCPGHRPGEEDRRPALSTARWLGRREDVGHAQACVLPRPRPAGLPVVLPPAVLRPAVLPPAVLRPAVLPPAVLPPLVAPPAEPARAVSKAARYVAPVGR